MITNAIYEQAKKLAKKNKMAAPNIQKVYWFPDDHEIRLLELEDEAYESDNGCVNPIQFNSSQDFFAPSSIAVIRSDEFEKLDLPKSWGSWKNAQELKLI